MKKLFRAMAALLREGESIVAATIFDKAGSTPRSEGSKMVVRSDGSIIGTIGGGRLEADVIARAPEVFRSRRHAFQHFDLNGEDAAGMAMICGGQGEILLDYLDAHDSGNADVYREAASILDRGGKAWLITSLGLGNGASFPSRQQCLVRHDGSTVGKLDGDPAFIGKLLSGPGKLAMHAEVQGERRFLVEPVRHGGTVFIFGAGHVSQKIAPLAETVGFRTVVLDDRAEFASRARFAEPTELMVLSSFSPLPELAVDENAYLVIVTRGHLHDKVVLEQALRTNAGYIGMIGSRRKRDKVYEALLAGGLGTSELERVHSPIGTEIKAETPEEIAVSIVGELIKVRAERSNGQG